MLMQVAAPAINLAALGAGLVTIGAAFGIGIIGKAAMEACLAYIAGKPFGASGRVVLTCNKENPKAIGLYKSLGFSETGNEDEEEIELSLRLNT